MLKLYQLNAKGFKMAEQIKKIENELHKFEYGYENGLITQKEFKELTSTLVFELKILARQI